MGLFIHQNVLWSEVDLSTDLQAVVARISLGKTVAVCNPCLPVLVPFRNADLYHLCEQLPCPFILLGDVNANNGHMPLRDVFCFIQRTYYVSFNS